MSMSPVVSPSRTYVAICNKMNFDGHYFRKFTLPEDEENTSTHAEWYFLNRLDAVACIDGAYSWEHFQDVKDVKDVQADLEKRLAEMRIQDEMEKPLGCMTEDDLNECRLDQEDDTARALDAFERNFPR